LETKQQGDLFFQKKFRTRDLMSILADHAAEQCLDAAFPWHDLDSARGMSRALRQASRTEALARDMLAGGGFVKWLTAALEGGAGTLGGSATSGCVDNVFFFFLIFFFFF
jgi:hypothetical protein